MLEVLAISKAAHLMLIFKSRQIVRYSRVIQNKVVAHFMWRHPVEMEQLILLVHLKL
jgi:hypothetical protein